eukprot:TRINITY_DN3154_c0_g1_i2.p1 TRINITY_DN3154_c0_g1~~TRINITY_DN3154_c0_g1_i2.p1  ORF type:complete len:1073 (+),score=183.87 TRINITY_DN3154_c0_g1_i2:124-3342(+)
MASVATIFAVICGSGLGFTDMHSDVLSLASGKTGFVKSGDGLLRKPLTSVEKKKDEGGNPVKHHQLSAEMLQERISAWIHKERYFKASLAEMKASLTQAEDLVKGATIRSIWLQSATRRGNAKIRQANVFAKSALDAIQRTHKKAALALSNAAAAGVESTRAQRISQRIVTLTGSFAPMVDVVPKTTERLKGALRRVKSANANLRGLRRIVKLVARKLANARQRVVYMKRMSKQAGHRVTEPAAMRVIRSATVVEAKAKQMIKAAKEQVRQVSCRLKASSNATVRCRAMKELTRAKRLAETGRALRSDALGLKHRLKKSFSTPSKKRYPLLFGSKTRHLANRASTLALQAVDRARSVVRGSSQLKRIAALLNGTERQPVTLKSTSKPMHVGKKVILKARNALDRLRSAFRKGQQLEQVANYLVRNAKGTGKGEERDVTVSNTSASRHIASLNQRSQIHPVDGNHDVSEEPSIAEVASTSTGAKAVATTVKGSKSSTGANALIHTSLVDRFHHILQELKKDVSHSGGSAKRLRRRLRVLSKTLTRTARQSVRAALRKFRQMRRVLKRASAVAAARKLSVEILEREKREIQFIRETSAELRSAEDDLDEATLESSMQARKQLTSRSALAAAAALPLSRHAKVWKKQAGELIARANSMKAPKRARARARRLIRLARRELRLSARCKRVIAKYRKHESVVKTAAARAARAKALAKKALASSAKAASKSRSMKRNAERAERGQPRGAKYVALAEKTAANARKLMKDANAVVRAQERRVKSAKTVAARDHAKTKLAEAKKKLKKAKLASKKGKSFEAKAKRLEQKENQERKARLAKKASEKASRTLKASTKSGKQISKAVKKQKKAARAAAKENILAIANNITTKLQIDLRIVLDAARIDRRKAGVALSILTGLGTRSDRVAGRTSRKAIRTALRATRRLKAAVKSKHLAHTSSQKARAAIKWHTAIETRKEAAALRAQAAEEAKLAKRNNRIASMTDAAVAEIKKFAKEARTLRSEGKSEMKTWTKRLKKSPSSSIKKVFGLLKKRVAAISKKATFLRTSIKTLGKKVSTSLGKAKQ